ncbi:MAG: hypothetical protein FWD71_20005 [Oscillospiraceae bacterium]|nr:hypothetical protein [Oscillospiraceae bacterium]
MKFNRLTKKIIYIFITVILTLTLSLTVLADTLFIEAESGTLDSTDPMLIGSGAGAYDGTYVYGENNGVEKITYDFELKEAGDYYLWFRLMGQDDNTNSYFVQIDGKGFNQDTGDTDGEFYTFDMWEPSEGFDYATNNPFLPTLEQMKDPVWCYNPNWHWIPLSYRDQTGDTPVRFDFLTQNFTAGKHTMTIMTREPDTYLDKIIITNDLTYDPRDMTSDPEALYLAAQTADTEAATDASPAVEAVTEQATVSASTGTTVVSAAQTGDNSMIYVMVFICAAVLSAVVLMVRRRKQQI